MSEIACFSELETIKSRLLDNNTGKETQNAKKSSDPAIVSVCTVLLFIFLHCVPIVCSSMYLLLRISIALELGEGMGCVVEEH